MEVKRNDSGSRFEYVEKGATAFLTFERTDGQLVLSHTEVPADLEHRGIGSKLDRAALADARERGPLPA